MAASVSGSAAAKASHKQEHPIVAGPDDALAYVSKACSVGRLVQVPTTDDVLPMRYVVEVLRERGRMVQLFIRTLQLPQSASKDRSASLAMKGSGKASARIRAIECWEALALAARGQLALLEERASADKASELALPAIMSASSSPGKVVSHDAAKYFMRIKGDAVSAIAPLADMGRWALLEAGLQGKLKSDDGRRVVSEARAMDSDASVAATRSTGAWVRPVLETEHPRH